MTVENFETQRLVVKRTKVADAPFSIEIWLDEEMGKYLSDPPREKAGDSYVEWMQTVEVYDGCYYFTAVSKEKGNYIGTCSAVPSEDQTHWDLGYVIHKTYWQQGYGTEMIKGLVEFCYNNGGRKITASVAKLNKGSNAVLRKLGFVAEKEGSFKKSGTDIVYDEYLYRLDLE
jgi:RimJ/RimL family protein N-acetyltransferase